MFFKRLCKSLLVLVCLAAVGMLSGSPDALGQGKGKGGGGGAVPPGRIFFQLHSFVDTPFGKGEQFIGLYSMKADGSDKREEPFMDWGGQPSRQLHDGHRWFLNIAAIEDGVAFPNGRPQRELFATRDDGLEVQLTGDPAIQITGVFNGSNRCWAHDDSFISFAALTWTLVESDGNFTGDDGQEWLVEAAIFVVEVDWSDGVPEAAAPIAVLDVGLYFASGAEWGLFQPTANILGLDWSPSGNQLLYQQVTQEQPGGYERYDLWVASFTPDATVTEITLGQGRQPEWSPDGARIAYSDSRFIFTVNPDGSDLLQVTKTAGNYDYDPHWSPEGAHLTFTRQTQSNQKASTYWQKNVLRVAATGGTPVNLTKDLDDKTYAAYARAWR